MKIIRGGEQKRELLIMELELELVVRSSRLALICDLEEGYWQHCLFGAVSHGCLPHEETIY